MNSSKWIAFIITGIVLLPMILVAQTKIIIDDGNWSNSSIWSGGSVAISSGDSVHMNEDLIVSVNSTYVVGGFSSANNDNLTIKNNGNLTVSSFSAQANTTINVNAGGVLTIAGDLTITNNLILTIQGSGIMTVQGRIKMGNSAALTVNGSLLVDGDFVAGSYTIVTVSGLVDVGGMTTVGSNSHLYGTGQFRSDGGCTSADLSGFCDQTPLPIELVEFKVEQNPGDIYLEWSTASELNFDYFILEKSANGKDFYEIARVAGHGTTKERHDYSFVDEKPLLGKSYYRLIEVDLDKTVVQLKTIRVDFAGARNFRLSPNPAVNGEVTMELNFVPLQEVAVAIYDLRGRIIDEWVLSERIRTVPLNVANGVYLVVVQGSNFRTSSRLVVR